MAPTAQDRMIRDIKSQSVQVCPNCNSVFQIPFEFKGRIMCPHCGNVSSYFNPDCAAPAGRGGI